MNSFQDSSTQSTLRHVILRAVGFFFPAAMVAAAATAAEPVRWPEGFHVPASTVSPDGRLGLLVPDGDHYVDRDGNRLVNVATGETLGVIHAETGMESMNHGSAHATWTADSKGLLWVMGGKWCARAIVYLRVNDGKLTWQKNLLETGQQELLRRTRKAEAAAYSAIVKLHAGNYGSAFPDGFTVDVKTIGKSADLPLQFIVALTSGSKDNGDPVSAMLESRMRGVLDADGSIKWSGFKVLAGDKVSKWRQCLGGGDRSEASKAMLAKLRKAVPEAWAALEAYREKHDCRPEWSLYCLGKPRAPDSFGVDFTVLLDTNPGPSFVGDPHWHPQKDFPAKAEIIAAWSGSLEEDGKLKWGAFKVLTGQEALRNKRANTEHLREVATQEVQKRVEAAAPETLASLRKFLATRPKPSAGMMEDHPFNTKFEAANGQFPHPAQLPYPFEIVLEPMATLTEEAQVPLAADFRARLAGVLQEDGSFNWGDFVLLRGEDARKARQEYLKKRYAAGWPSFLSP